MPRKASQKSAKLFRPLVAPFTKQFFEENNATAKRWQEERKAKIATGMVVEIQEGKNNA